MRSILVVCMACMVLVASETVRARQSGIDIKKYLSMIESGQAEQVRGELPSLMTKYPNNPGVLYIQGILTRDGAEAVRIYQSIVDNFPKSEWAPSALYKVYQFYYALGLYRTAELKMGLLRKDYPNSTYVTKGSDAETKGLAEEKDQPLTPPADTPSSASQAAQADVAAVPDRTENKGQFTLQVGAYSSQVNSEKQKVFFESLQFPVEVITKVKDSRSLYIVMIGSFGSYDEAKAKGGEIRKKYNIESIIVAR